MVGKRIEWVDAFKGLGIFCVVFYHSLGDTKLGSYISSFLMPLFFFMAGFLFERGRSKGYVDFALRKIRTRLVPYTLFLVITYALYVFIQSRKIGVGYITLLLYYFKPSLLDAFIWGTAEHINHVGNPPLWFLPCLFVTENYFYWISKMSTLLNISLALVAIAIVAYVERIYVGTMMPYGIDVALTATVFYGSGFIIKELMSRNVIKLPQNTVHFMTLALVLMASNVFLWVLSGQSSMGSRNYGQYNFFLFYVCALSGILAYALLSMKLVRIRWLRFLGQNSLIIYIMNNYMMNFNGFFIAPRLDSFVGPLLTDEMVSVMDSMNFFFLWNSVIIIISTIPFIYLINRVLPFLIGRRYHRQRVLMVT